MNIPYLSTRLIYYFCTVKNIIPIIAFLLIVGACKRQSKQTPLSLGPYSNELASLIIRAHMAPMIERREVCCSLMHEVDRQLKDDTTAHTRAVRLYVYAAMPFKRDASDSSAQILDSALHLVDATNYPVMAHRIKAEIVKRELPVTKENYLVLMDEIKYFRQLGDTLSMALLEVACGPFFHHAGRMDEAMETTKQAMATLKSIGQQRLVGRTRVNEAFYFALQNDTSAWDSVNRILLADEEIRLNSPKFREGVLRNTYLITHDTLYLNEGWNIVQKHPEMKALSTAYYSLFAEKLLENNEPDSALRLLRLGRAVGNSIGFPNANHRLLMLGVFAKVFEEKGIPDSALTYLKLFLKEKDSINTLNNVEESMRAKYNHDMETMRYEHERHRDNERWLWTVAVFMAILGGTGSFIWVWKQRQNTMLRLAYEQSTIERTRRQLAANALAIREKDNLLSEMNRHIEGMISSGAMNQSVASDLQAMIRLHAAGKEEWEAFESLLVKVHPNFMIKLHELAPEMSMKYCRLAAYLHVGMSSLQISRLLMIQPMSVYQARWRLRKQLSIPKGVDIEKFLEQLGSE